MCADETNGGVCIVSVSIINDSVVKVCILRLSVRVILVVFVFAIIFVVIVILCYGRPECRLELKKYSMHFLVPCLCLAQ